MQRNFEENHGKTLSVISPSILHLLKIIVIANAKVIDLFTIVEVKIICPSSIPFCNVIKLNSFNASLSVYFPMTSVVLFKVQFFM